MKAFAVTAAEHNTACKFVNNEHLPILHHIVNVAAHDALCTDGHIDMVLQGDIVEIHQVLHMEIGLRLFHALLGEHRRLRLFIDDIVGVRLFLGVFLSILLLDAHHLQALGKFVRLAIEVRGGVALAGDDQRRARLVDQNGVDLVDDAEIVAALDFQLFIGHHVVAQVIEAHLIVGAVCDIRRIGLAPLGVVFLMYDQTHLEPQEAVNLAHPLRVSPGEVIVDRDHMDAFAG